MTELRATYRLQLNSSFGFDDARSLMPYLSELGISHLYLSPVWQAREGSTHGYDVVDPRRVSSELGGENGLRALAAAAREAGMGLVLDVVPNHMAANAGNPFWSDPELRGRFFDLDPATGRWRRFFDIDDLAGVRQEYSEVIETTHAKVLELVRDGVADGLRIDHPDGLADPAEYLQRLRDGGAERVWVEKILDPAERLRDWPVSGTVGYEFLNDVCALFVDPAGEPLTALWESVSGDRRGFGEVAHEAKHEQVLGAFAPERDRLHRVCPAIDLDDLSRALAALPVYRTYVEPAAGTVFDLDRADVAGLTEAVRHRLLLEVAAEEFVTRFQQTTPAIMAKGVEDTAFYRYSRLLALNDVGGDPSRFSIDVDRFHAGCLERAERFPLNLLTTMTHDAKRSADVRARIGALASDRGRVARVRGAVDGADRAAALGRGAGRRGAVLPVPDARRSVADLLRADRRVHAEGRCARRSATPSWVQQDHEWEAGVEQFCQALYADREFISSLEEFVARRRAARRSRRARTARAEADGARRAGHLPGRRAGVPGARRPGQPAACRLGAPALSRSHGSRGGAAPDADNRKQWLIWKLLALRARRPEAFSGAYEPVDAGPETVSFVRGGVVLVAVRIRAAGGAVDPPDAGWDDVVRDDEHGLAVFERV